MIPADFLDEILPDDWAHVELCTDFTGAYREDVHEVILGDRD